MKSNVPRSQIRSLTNDLKKWRIRHHPFRRTDNGVEIELYPTAKTDFLLLKYNTVSLDRD